MSPPEEVIDARQCVVSLHLLSSAAIAEEGHPSGKRSVHVAGCGTDLLNGAIVQSKKKPTSAGELQRSTEVVELKGDLNGKVLYQVTTVIDTQKHTSVNTGDQVLNNDSPINVRR